MKLRTQLLLINLLSVAVLVIAVVYSYSIMLLNLNQARILTVIAVGAGLISAAFYWLMTVPISRSMKRLMKYAEEVGNGRFDAQAIPVKGPSEVRQLSQSIQDMNRKLKDNFKALETMERTRRELIANVSHDLRTPIASVQSFVEALDDGVIESRETAHHYLTTIHREVRRLSALIDDLFELSRLEAGQQPFQPTPTYIDTVILEALESHKVHIQNKQIEVAVSIEDDIGPLLLMPDKIARVLNNLLDNAIRHSPARAGLEVRVNRLASENYIEVVVRDEGEGIADEDRDVLFHRFYRGDKSRQRKSGEAGLGLAIAKSLVELHGGTIGVRSPGPSMGGSEFWIRLPIFQEVQK